MVEVLGLDLSQLRTRIKDWKKAAEKKLEIVPLGAIIALLLLRLLPL